MGTQCEDEPWLHEPELLEEEVATPAHKIVVSFAWKCAHSTVSCPQAHVSIGKEALLWGNPDLLQERQEVSPGCSFGVLLPCTSEGALETGLAIEVMSYDDDPTNRQ